MRFAYVAWLAVVASAFTLSTASAAEKPSGPWVDPANADRYAFVGHDVWDVATGKLIAAGAAPLVYTNSRPVAGRPDRLWMRATELGLPGMPGEGLLYSTTDLYQSVHPTLNGEKWSSMGDFPGFWIASDLRRAVWIEKGDVWRGKVDWTAGKVVDRKQVTHVGVFAGKSAALWTGETLYVNAGFDPAKPIVRIDLQSGATEEIETHHVFNAVGGNYSAQTQAAMASPSAFWLISLTPQTIYTFDARTGKAGAIPNPLNDRSVSPTPELVLNDVPPVWLGDDAVVLVNPQSVVTKLDLAKQEAKVLFSSGASPLRFHVFGVLPGGRYLDIKGEAPAGQMEPPIFKERFLLDLVSGQKIATSLTQDADGGLWLDASKLAYPRKTGGLSGVGTWLYDRNTNASIRISPTQLETTRMVLLRDGKEIWAVSSAAVLFRAKVDGSGAEELGPSQMFAPLQFPTGTPVDLGLPPPPPAAAAAPALAPPGAAAAPTIVRPAQPATPPTPAAAAAPAPAPQQLYAVCWGGQTGPDATAYFAAPFEVRTLNNAGWSAAFKAFLQDKYAFNGLVHCATAQSLATANQHIQQNQDQKRARWKIVETDWKFE